MINVMCTPSRTPVPWLVIKTLLYVCLRPWTVEKERKLSFPVFVDFPGYKTERSVSLCTVVSKRHWVQCLLLKAVLFITLRECAIPRSVIKPINNFFFDHIEENLWEKFITVPDTDWARLIRGERREGGWGGIRIVLRACEVSLATIFIIIRVPAEQKQISRYSSM